MELYATSIRKFVVKIATAAQEFYENPALRQQFGQAGRAYAVERFSSERYVRDVEALYRMLIKERKVRV